MRAMVAAVLLLLQLEPLVGMGLCLALSGADGERMEAGCPMPEARATQPTSLQSHSGVAVSPWDAAQDCALSEACAVASSTVRSIHLAVRDMPTHSHVVLWPSIPLYPAIDSAPPVPPPRS